MIINLEKVYRSPDLDLISHVLSRFVEMVFLTNEEERFYLLDLVLLKNGLGNSDLNWEIDRSNNDGIVSYQIVSDPLFIHDVVSTCVNLSENDFVFFLKDKMKEYSDGNLLKKKVFDEIVDRYNFK